MNWLFGRLQGFYLAEKVKSRFMKEDGQTLVEYSLILVLIALVVILMMRGVGSTVNNSFSAVNSGVAQ